MSLSASLSPLLIVSVTFSVDCDLSCNRPENDTFCGINLQPLRLKYGGSLIMPATTELSQFCYYVTFSTITVTLPTSVLITQQ